MKRHIFLDKTNSIYKKKPFLNVGLNPILELTYGNGNIARGLIHFNEEQIMDLVEDKTFANLEKLSFRLKMVNCFSVEGYPYEKLLKNGLEIKQRAASFDLMLMKLPCEFDAGRGFDYVSDFWINNNRSYSEDGSSWYERSNGNIWPVDEDKINLFDKTLNFQNHNIWIMSGGTKVRVNLEGGVFSDEYIHKQIDLYNSGLSSDIIDVQHFDYGNENLDMDITDYVMGIISSEHNYGLMLMFSPRFEKMETEITQYVGFFTDNTNTFFHPYVECNYCEYIMDNRASFSLKKENRLYLYVNEDGIPCNLDEKPTCKINDVEYSVEQAQKGVYYALISGLSEDLEEGSIGYDTWGNLALNGQEMDDVEMEFEVQKTNNFISIGHVVSTKDNVVPSVYGINDCEDIHRGEKREVTVDFREEYDINKIKLINSGEYRLYIMDGNREFTVLDYQPVEMGFLKNFFVIYAEDLIPQEYYIDIRIRSGRETKYYKKILKFRVVSDVTERYE